jgi:hypothetical protein
MGPHNPRQGQTSVGCGPSACQSPEQAGMNGCLERSARPKPILYVIGEVHGLNTAQERYHRQSGGVRYWVPWRLRSRQYAPGTHWRQLRLKLRVIELHLDARLRDRLERRKTGSCPPGAGLGCFQKWRPLRPPCPRSTTAAPSTPGTSLRRWMLCSRRYGLGRAGKRPTCPKPRTVSCHLPPLCSILHPKM